MINGETYFVGKDVALVLGYANTMKAIRDHIDNEDKLTERIVLSGQKRQAILINKSGFYASSSPPNRKAPNASNKVLASAIALPLHK